MKKWFLVLSVIFLVTCPASAETKFGISPAFVMFDLSDPDGSTEKYDGLQGIGFVSIHDISNKHRIMGFFNYYDFKLDASTSNIGQEVTTYQIGAIIQRIIRVQRSLNFYAGIGAAYNNSDFDARYTVDSDGYLQRRYADRSENSFSLIVNISKEWEISNKFDIGADMSYQYGIGDTFSGLKAAVNLLYKF